MQWQAHQLLISRCCFPHSQVTQIYRITKLWPLERLMSNSKYLLLRVEPMPAAVYPQGSRLPVTSPIGSYHGCVCKSLFDWIKKDTPLLRSCKHRFFGTIIAYQVQQSRMYPVQQYFTIIILHQRIMPHISFNCIESFS